MRINGMNGINNVYKAKKSTKAYETNSVSTSRDEVTLSTFAKDLAVAKKEVDKTSDVRMDKVNEIKAQIEAGTYNVSASQVADKLIGESQEL